MMTVRERWLYEGAEEGKISALEEFMELLRQGYTPEEVYQKLMPKRSEQADAHANVQ